MGIPAIVTAGEGRASRAVYGESKVYLEIEDHTLVARVVAALQQVPEVSEVWVVGNAPRLEQVLREDSLARQLSKPLHVVPQFRNLYENCWETFRRALPGAPPEGRDPTPEDDPERALFLSADIPFATPHEISSFVRRAGELECDYALGITTEEAMRGFYPQAPGEPGIHMAYFNLREGRFRQTNLHLVRPAGLGNRASIEEMYEHRYQRQFGQIAALAWRLFFSEGGGPRTVFYFALMQVASVAERRGWRGVADAVRRWIPIATIEGGVSSLLRTRFRFVVTDVGGCAVDIDNEADYDAARARFAQWQREQRERAEAVAPLPLPATAAGAGARRGDDA